MAVKVPFLLKQFLFLWMAVEKNGDLIVFMAVINVKVEIKLVYCGIQAYGSAV